MKPHAAKPERSRQRHHVDEHGRERIALDGKARQHEREDQPVGRGAPRRGLRCRLGAGGDRSPCQPGDHEMDRHAERRIEGGIDHNRHRASSSPNGARGERPEDRGGKARNQRQWTIEVRAFDPPACTIAVKAVG